MGVFFPCIMFINILTNFPVVSGSSTLVTMYTNKPASIEKPTGPNDKGFIFI